MTRRKAHTTRRTPYSGALSLSSTFVATKKARFACPQTTLSNLGIWGSTDLVYLWNLGSSIILEVGRI